MQWIVGGLRAQIAAWPGSHRASARRRVAPPLTSAGRFEYGYGLTPEIVRVAAASSPALIITVDNGISSIAGVEEAKSKGWRHSGSIHNRPGSGW